MSVDKKNSQIDSAGTLAIMEQELNKYRLYESKLYLFLKALEVRDIQELMNLESPYLVAVALEIKKAAKGNAGIIADLMARLTRKDETIATMGRANRNIARDYANAAINCGTMHDAITRAINDSESGDGWGPDVTVVAYLEKALEDVKENKKHMDE